MSADGRLGAPPNVEVEVVSDEGTDGRGFLRVRSMQLRCRYPDGSHSASFPYQLVERDSMDAVAIVLWARGEQGLLVCLRSQLRPPLCFRHEYDVPMAADGQGPVQWEVPAGLIEPGEHGWHGVFTRASAEALEEVGLALSADRFEKLGEPTSLSPGMCAEKLFFVACEVDPGAERLRPEGDGHALEEHAEVRFVPLAEALSAVADGRLHDIKTELALHRLLAARGAS